MVSIRAALASACVVSCSAANIDPQHAMNLTMFHINPLSAGVFPADEDTGDLDGILYFYLGTFVLPLECASDPSFRTSFDCTNPERTRDDMVHTLVEIEVDDRLTGYSACNLCTTGIDAISHQPCEIGTYQCNCFVQPPAECDASRVGTENISIFIQPARTPLCNVSWTKLCANSESDGDQCHDCLTTNKEALAEAGCTELDSYQFCPARSTCQSLMESQCGNVTSNNSACNACLGNLNVTDFYLAGCEGYDGYNFCGGLDACTGKVGEEWKCYNANLPSKTGGKWYSPTESALCHDEDEGTCGWRVRSMSTVNETCVKDSVMTVVEAAAPDCFGACGPRNASSPCWAECFFDTILGPEARHFNGANVSRGMPMEALERGYLNAFLPEIEGGCPRIPADQSAGVTFIEKFLV